jgi:hypothetical protein
MITITKDSHLDHALTDAQIAYILTTFADRDGFFIETITLPVDLGTVPCGLYGPTMGDEPIVDPEGALLALIGPAVRHAFRAGRSYTSRLCFGRARPSRLLTVIAGPHDGAPCVLYTAFGGPLAPKEPGDPTLKETERAASEAFWNVHALAGD